jgi:hypothetical protein
MAHYAKIDSNNIVISVHVVKDSDENGSEENAITFLTSIHGDITPSYWKKTSYNTHNGSHYLIDSEGIKTLNSDQSNSLRKNFASKGFTYDESRDAFIIPSPMKCNSAIQHHSWVLDENKCCYVPPIEWPNESHPNDYEINGEPTICSWDEHKQRMVGQLVSGGSAEGQPRPSDDQVTLYVWVPETATWIDSGFTFGQFLAMDYTGD